MRAGDNFPAGELQLTLSFPNWKEGGVEPAMYRLPLVRRNITPSVEHERAVKLPADHGVLAVTPDQKTFIIGSHRAAQVRLYDVASGFLLDGPKISDGTEHTAFKVSPNGRMLAYGEMLWNRKTRDVSGSLVLWDMNARKEIAKLTLDPPQRPYPMSFSSDGTSLITDDLRRVGSGPDLKELVVWDVVNRKADRRTYKDYGYLAVNPQNRLIARAIINDLAGTETTKVGFFDWATNKEVGQLPEERGNLYSLLFSPDGKLLLGWSRNGPIVVWDVAAKRVLRRLKHESSESINNVVVSPDSKLLAATLSAAGNAGKTPGTVSIWTLSDGMRVATLHGHSGAVYFAHFLANRKLITNGFNEYLRFWNLESF